ncbi:hypothetical protein CHRYSEOSP005_22690 [Chryseobacterium sp. Alg-005]|uniref:hypothetical protein n=1 Tax=Chryseobacterium sp. Alg-005 TaxID=3159516 RepID=UPI003555869B
MSFYSKFSDQDLIESYKNQIDYQGKASKEIIEEIESRGSLEDFQSTIENQKLILDERNRIIREIHQHFMDKRSQNECFSLITSDLVSEEDIQNLILTKYTHIHQNVENLKTDPETWFYSLFGAFVASIISTIVLSIVLYNFSFLAVFNFSLLIPAYIINYWIIRLFTGKTRVNLAVFIASFLATVLNCIYFILFIS